MGGAGRAADGGAGRRTADGGRGAVKVRTPHKDLEKKHLHRFWLAVCWCCVGCLFVGWFVGFLVAVCWFMLFVLRKDKPPSLPHPHTALLLECYSTVKVFGSQSVPH